jgi:hypothetical protein
MKQYTNGFIAKGMNIFASFLRELKESEVLSEKSKKRAKYQIELVLKKGLLRSITG